MFPEATWIVGFFIGAAFGSFLNVIIYRMPRGLPLHKPAYSFCPACKTPLGLADLMPLFSWLFSRGRCRHCAAKVSARYFWVEMATGIVFAGVWQQYLIQGEDPARAIAYSAACATLIAIIWIDWEFYIIPDEVNAFLWYVGVGLTVWWIATKNAFGWTWGMPTALVGWLAGALAIWLIALLGLLLFRKDAMGHGDIKMARGFGAVLGPGLCLASIGLAVVLGAVLGIAQIFFRSRHETSDEAPATLEPAESETSLGAGMSNESEDEDDYEPESIGSLMKCGLGYVLCIDIVGLFIPKLYESWFGESPWVSETADDDFEVERTMIPFGPYLALGAIVAMIFQAQLLGLIDQYVKWVAPN